MLQIKNNSVTDDYILNSKHTTNCSSKEFQIPEECNCWRVEFAKHVLAKQESKKTIYVASKTKFAPIWKKFRSEGYPIVSSWLDEADKTNSNLTELWKKNIEESSSCGVLVYFAEIPTGITSKKETVSNGGLVEVGSALSNDIPVVWDAMEYPTICKHPNVKFVNGCEDIDHETEIEFALNDAMKILNLVPPVKIKTLAKVYLDFIQTKWDPKYNFKFGLDDWKKNQTVQNVQKYLDHFSKYYPATDEITHAKYKLSLDQIGNEYYYFKNNPVITKWWDIKNRVRLSLPEEQHPLYVWDSFVAWCWADELPRKTFEIGLKEKEITVKVYGQTIASIPSVKCRDAKKLSVEITDLSLTKDSTNPVIKTVSTVVSPKARKPNRIKTHSNYVKCTNKFRRVVSTLVSEITCGHCLKLGKKKGLWT